MPYKDKQAKARWQKAYKQTLKAERQERLNSLSLSLSLKDTNGTGRPDKKGRPDLRTKRRLSKVDVWALKRVGINPGRPLVSQAIQMMVSELEAVRAHLSWHHESQKFPDLATRLERQEAEIMALRAELHQYITQHQADHIVEGYRGDGPLTPDELADHEDTQYHDREVRP